MSDPLEVLDRWLVEADEAGVPAPRAMTLATATAEGRPSARLVSLKRLTDGALNFTTALWTRKAGELRDNPHAAATFYWPAQAIPRSTHEPPCSACASVASPSRRRDVNRSGDLHAR